LQYILGQELDICELAQKEFLKYPNLDGPGVVVHTYNLRYSGGRDQEDQS
jgi:hypothetical protein